MVQCFKWLFAHSGRTRINGFKLKESRFRFRNKFLIVRMVKHWSRLAEELQMPDPWKRWMANDQVGASGGWCPCTCKDPSELLCPNLGPAAQKRCEAVGVRRTSLVKKS